MHVDYILNILMKAGVSLKFRKSEFFKLSVDYLGHTIRPGKLEVTQSGTAALNTQNIPLLRLSYAVTWDLVTSTDNLSRISHQYRPL